MSYWCQTPQSAKGKSLLQLVSAIKYIDWEAVEKRILSNPEDCLEKDSFGVSALFYCIRKRHINVPFHIIEHIVSIHPDAIFIQDRMTGRNALHIAVEMDNLCVVKLILKACPEAATCTCLEGKLPIHYVRSLEACRVLIDHHPSTLRMQSNSGQLPLFTACSDNLVPARVVEVLINEGKKFGIGQIYSCSEGQSYCGGTIVKDKYGDIPLKVLFRRILFSGNSNPDDFDIDLWEKMSIVLRGTYLSLHNIPTWDDSISFHMIHALIECGSNPRIIRHAIYLHPNEVNARDSYGNTPLCIAASKVEIVPEIIDILLQADNRNVIGSIKSAQMQNGDKRLPLHVAVESGRTWKNGIERIVDAEPLALETRDIKTHMYPFMLAAIPSYKWDNTSFDTIFYLLRRAPHVVKTFCNE